MNDFTSSGVRHFTVSSRMRLDLVLVKSGVVTTRSSAQKLIEDGRIFVDGVVATKAATLVDPGKTIELRCQERQWASRGAYKLLRGLETFGISPEKKVCMDVGASTGGFSDVLLERGAERIYAVDVGYGQLAWRLRKDPRVVVMERTNARYLLPTQFPEPMDLIVSDASFISLRLLLPPLEKLLAPSGEMVVLVKPQFEVGRERIGKKGVVRNPRVHEAVLLEFRDFVRTSLRLFLHGVDFSPLRGPQGNIEFLAHLAFSEPAHVLDDADLARVVQEGHAHTNTKASSEKQCGGEKSS
jgi:23S rRNA (cytidine1920-2'-O)/16S rRNA (cytidine1409-2'-O)-methyltransferase